MKKWTGMITNLTMLTQFGLSLVTPLFLCLALCWWLCDRFSVGTWIYLLGFFFGIGGGAVTAWKFGQSVLRHQKRIETEPPGKKTAEAMIRTAKYTIPKQIPHRNRRFSAMFPVILPPQKLDAR